MIVPIDLLKPILDDLLTFGRPNRPPRPWLGLYATEIEDKVVVVGLAGTRSRAARRDPDRRHRARGRRRRGQRARRPRSARSGRSAMPASRCRCSIYRDGRTFEVTGSVRRPHPLPQGAELALRHRLQRITPPWFVSLCGGHREPQHALFGRGFDPLTPKLPALKVLVTLSTGRGWWTRSAISGISLPCWLAQQRRLRTAARLVRQVDVLPRHDDGDALAAMRSPLAHQRGAVRGSRLRLREALCVSE